MVRRLIPKSRLKHYESCINRQGLTQRDQKQVAQQSELQYEQSYSSNSVNRPQGQKCIRKSSKVAKNSLKGLIVLNNKLMRNRPKNIRPKKRAGRNLTHSFGVSKCVSSKTINAQTQVSSRSISQNPSSKRNRRVKKSEDLKKYVSMHAGKRNIRLKRSILVSKMKNNNSKVLKNVGINQALKHRKSVDGNQYQDYSYQKDTSYLSISSLVSHRPLACASKKSLLIPSSNWESARSFIKNKNIFQNKRASEEVSAEPRRMSIFCIRNRF
ncbi:unnamed protein product [Moneuplotes crassus]|uniref:Uncharacterized protein n=1 Tax=Euplotes crassus TaxID=5936 RepID=A0AAD1Y8G8_EUPCR|nr:unnamed protein product [Moneuplotes crassus]